MTNFLRSVRLKRACFFALTLCFSTSTTLAAEAEIDIGLSEQVAILFSYPNPGHEDQTLQETVQHYLSHAMKRESLGAYKAVFRMEQDRGKMIFKGPSTETVNALARRYKSYFQIGETGSLEYSQLRQSTPSWDPEWRFLLPQGLAIENARVVEIMDFPPVTLLTKQDYLDSKTTNQWWSLLGQNGVSDSQKPLYSSILDIVLVAAPASHGKKLKDAGIYDGHFPMYTDAMLKLLSTNREKEASRPLLALGFPIREWIKKRWNVDVGVNEVVLLEIEAGRFSPAIGGNHPAYYLRSRGSKGDDDPSVRAILRQDLITAAWATEMGRSPEADPYKVLEKSKNRWSKENSKVNSKILKQMGIKPPIEASKLRKLGDLEPSEQELLKLEMEFYNAEHSFEE